jgi:hypothetical protein
MFVLARTAARAAARLGLSPAIRARRVPTSASWVARGRRLRGRRRNRAACRVADGSMSMDEAKQRNAAHYERFYGKKMPKKMFF